MDKNASLWKHSLKIKDIQKYLDSINQKMEEEDMVVIMLKRLPCAYEHFIETLNITSTNIVMKFDELWNSLLQWDRWQK